jgi:hypothetical protein
MRTVGASEVVATGVTFNYIVYFIHVMQKTVNIFSKLIFSISSISKFPEILQP